jgi:eukaryotic translation initiation factor 2C
MKFSARQLQDLTNWLCYTYVRATLPVGYAPPAYYADRLCERVRCYFNDFYHPDDSRLQAIGQGQNLSADDLEEAKRGEAWFNRYNAGGDNPHGPWNKKLNDTMFWM